MYTAYTLPEHERTKLLSLFHPKYPNVIAHHITLQYPAKKSTPIPDGNEGYVVGYCDNELSLEALIFSINGTTIRPDDKIFHCTWSLDESKGVQPKDSNMYIQTLGYQKFNQIIKVDLIPELLD